MVKKISTDEMLRIKYPELLSFRHPIKSVKLLSKTGKSLSKSIKEIKEINDELEDIKKLTSVSMQGRRQAMTDVQLRRDINKFLSTLKDTKQDINKQIKNLKIVKSELL